MEMKTKNICKSLIALIVFIVLIVACGESKKNESGGDKYKTVDLNSSNISTIKIGKVTCDKNAETLEFKVTFEKDGEVVVGDGEMTVNFYASQITDMNTADKSLPVGNYKVKVEKSKFSNGAYDCKVKYTNPFSSGKVVSSWGVVNAEIGSVSSNYQSGFMFK